jgi:hypothetical protein
MVSRFAFALIAFVSLGCGPDYGAYQGFWEGKWDQQLAPETPSTVAATIQKYRVRLLPEGKFSMMRKGMPFEGRCQYSGNQITLVPETSVGRPTLEPVNFRVVITIGEAETLTLLDEEAGVKTTLQMKKVQPWE